MHPSLFTSERPFKDIMESDKPLYIEVSKEQIKLEEEILEELPSRWNPRIDEMYNAIKNKEELRNMSTESKLDHMLSYSMQSVNYSKSNGKYRRTGSN